MLKWWWWFITTISTCYIQTCYNADTVKSATAMCAWSCCSNEASVQHKEYLKKSTPWPLWRNYGPTPPQERTFCSPSTRVTWCTPRNERQLTMLSTSTPCWALQPLWNIHVRLPFHMMACAGYGIRIQTPPLTPAQVMAPEARCFDSTLGVCSGDNGMLSRGHDEALR